MTYNFLGEVNVNAAKGIPLKESHDYFIYKKNQVLEDCIKNPRKYLGDD